MKTVLFDYYHSRRDGDGQGGTIIKPLQTASLQDTYELAPESKVELTTYHNSIISAGGYNGAAFVMVKPPKYAYPPGTFEIFDPADNIPRSPIYNLTDTINFGEIDLPEPAWGGGRPQTIRIKNLHSSKTITLQRVIFGRVLDIPLTPSREPGIRDTTQVLWTLSGIPVEGVTGYTYRTLELESVPNAVTQKVWDELEHGAPQYMRGLPIAVWFEENECLNLPFRGFYGLITSKVVLQSALRGVRYQIKLSLREAF